MANSLPPTAFYPLPDAAAATATLCHQPNFISATSLPHLQQIHAHLLKNPHHPHHDQNLLHLLLSSLSFPSYTLSLLPFIHTHRPPPPPIVNKLLKQLSRSDNPDYALLLFQTMQNKSFPIDRFCFPPLLKAASKAVALSEGKMIHGLAAKLEYVSDPFVETALVGMYAACGLISEARLVFDKMSHKDVVTWNIMIDG